MAQGCQRGEALGWTPRPSTRWELTRDFTQQGRPLGPGPKARETVSLLRLSGPSRAVAPAEARQSFEDWSRRRWSASPAGAVATRTPGFRREGWGWESVVYVPVAGRGERRGRGEGKERKNGRGDQQKLEEAELEKGVMEEGGRFSPMRPEIWGKGLAFPVRLGLPKSRLHASP